MRANVKKNDCTTVGYAITIIITNKESSFVPSYFYFLLFVFKKSEKRGEFY
jgi:hypothetical protein